MRLIGRRIQSELHRADNPAAEPRRQQHGVARGNRARNFAKECQRLLMRERRHEADAGAAFYTVDQYRRQLIQRGIRNRRIESNYFSLGAHTARSSFEATVASAFNR